MHLQAHLISFSDSFQLVMRIADLDANKPFKKLVCLKILVIKLICPTWSTTTKNKTACCRPRDVMLTTKH